MFKSELYAVKSHKTNKVHSEYPNQALLIEQKM